MTAGAQLALPIGQQQQGEVQVYRIMLPFLPPSKNVYDGWPIQWKSSAKKKWTRHLLEKFEQEQMPTGALKVGMAASLVFPTAARRDTQNYAQCLWHWVPDALVRYGAVPDDTPEYVEIGPNWGMTMLVDGRANRPKAKRQRTHLALALQMRP